jgi:hypothetical protein
MRLALPKHVAVFWGYTRQWPVPWLMIDSNFWAPSGPGLVCRKT